MTEPRARKAAKAKPPEAAEPVVPPEPVAGEIGAPDSPASVEAPPVEPAPKAAPPRARRSGRAGAVIALLAGGAIAAMLGFGVARLAVPDGWPLAATGPLEARLTEQGAALAALTGALDSVKAGLANRPSEDRVIALEAAMVEANARLDADRAAPGADTIEPRLAALEVALARLEAQPTVAAGVSAALAGFANDLAALRAELDARKGVEAAASRAVEAQAAALKAEAAATAALAKVQAAVTSGAPFAEALSALQDAGQDIPPALSAATDGLPTLAALQAAFPAAARAALDAALRADMGTSLSERLTAFVRSQTGARSLTPREGADPDAVLSRAEAALQGGDLAGALAEIGALPPEAQAALADWQALAERRLAATDALAALVAAMAKP